MPTPSEIKEARDLVNLTATEAARLLGHSWATWHQWESGRRRMSEQEWRLFLHLAGIERLRFGRERRG